jgi:hypothetical protein
VADGVFVVLDHQNGVAQVTEALEGLDQAAVVALVEADGGLEHVEYAAQAGADLGGKTDALPLAAGKGCGVAVQGQVVETDGA